MTAPVQKISALVALASGMANFLSANGVTAKVRSATPSGNDHSRCSSPFKL